jgi:hypothetical protein
VRVATEPVELLEDVVLPPLLSDGPDQKASARHRLAREGFDAMRDRARFLPGSQYGTVFERPSGTCSPRARSYIYVSADLDDVEIFFLIVSAVPETSGRDPVDPHRHSSNDKGPSDHALPVGAP